VFCELLAAEWGHQSGLFLKQEGRQDIFSVKGLAFVVTPRCRKRVHRLLLFGNACDERLEASEKMMKRNCEIK
jgi:hypothetical protein